MNLVETKMDRMKTCERMLATPMTCNDLAKTLGLPMPSVRTYVRELHDRGRVHVASWQKSGNLVSAMYVAGGGEDVERPSAQQSQRGAGHDDFRRNAVEVCIRRDDMVAAFFGQAKRQEVAV
jgi:predicted ArsR family transcriptional regulator